MAYPIPSLSPKFPRNLMSGYRKDKHLSRLDSLTIKFLKPNQLSREFLHLHNQINLFSWSNMYGDSGGMKVLLSPKNMISRKKALSVPKGISVPSPLEESSNSVFVRKALTTRHDQKRCSIVSTSALQKEHRSLFLILALSK